MDIDLHPAADIQADVRRPLPLPSGSASLIVGEHVFEHLSHPSVTQAFLAECHRVLAPGGALRLSVPDAGEMLRAYATNDVAWFEHARQWHPDWCSTHMDQVNFVFRQDGQHLYAWDAPTLVAVFESAGFSNVAAQPFDSELDSEEREWGTLRVQGSRG